MSLVLQMRSERAQLVTQVQALAQIEAGGAIPADDLGLDSLFTDQKKRWAKIQPVGTAVYANGIQTDVKITHRVIFYYLKGMSDSHEVVHGGSIYRVRRVADMNGTRRFTVLEVEELGAAQAGGGIYG